MSEPILVFPAGTQVVIAGEITATIHCVSIRQDTVVSYQVVWWNGRSRHEEWVWASEVAPIFESAPKRTVGFAS